MVHQLISAEECAECKGCCFFGKNDAWEIPSAVTVNGDEYSAGLLYCDQLGHNGCLLGGNKPIECAMFPFRVMRLGEQTVIALARYCKPVMQLPLNRVARFASDKAEAFLALARKNPEIVKEYNREYIVLMVVQEG